MREEIPQRTASHTHTEEKEQHFKNFIQCLNFSSSLKRFPFAKEEEEEEVDEESCPRHFSARESFKSTFAAWKVLSSSLIFPSHPENQLNSRQRKEEDLLRHNNTSYLPFSPLLLVEFLKERLRLFPSRFYQSNKNTFFICLLPFHSLTLLSLSSFTSVLSLRNIPQYYFFFSNFRTC